MPYQMIPNIASLTLVSPKTLYLSMLLIVQATSAPQQCQLLEG